jgi:lipopolysaccharide/colanic/teichoic acid biosynthesis glycosyltransferase
MIWNVLQGCSDMKQELGFDQLQAFDPLLAASLARERNGYYFSKRVLDIIFAALALILLLPIMLLIAIVIMIDSRGPAIFVQERIGARRHHGNNSSQWNTTGFNCYKFRTMVCNADPALHQAYVHALISNDCQGMAAIQGKETQARKLVTDPRVTRVGRFLRKSSLDELPQFWNILRGDMSLVGPRPPIPYEVEMYEPWHRLRLQAKPGLTGLWQVTGRSCADFDDMIRQDIAYIQNQNFWLDLEIILRTPIAVISTKGAH